MGSRPIYPHELLELAQRLAGRESGRGRPRTIELRRAVSTAYYAAFHRLTWAAAVELLGTDDERVFDVCSWITHTDTLNLTRAVQKLADQQSVATDKKKQEPTPGPVAALFPLPLDPRLVLFCENFVDLQQQRHLADYDDRYEVTKLSVLGLVQDAEDAVSAVRILQREREAGFTLLLRLAVGAIRIAKDRSR